VNAGSRGDPAGSAAAIIAQRRLLVNTESNEDRHRMDAASARSRGSLKALEFLTGYLIEKSLAVDNIFDFLMVVPFFGVAAEYPCRALIHGVISAILLRAIMIPVGLSLAIVGLTIATFMFASLWVTGK
jgi:predicted tellurium resistance membrane protein TerC